MQGHINASLILALGMAPVAAPIHLATAQSSPGRASADSATVVFVCEHGTAKSVIAMSYFTLLAQARGLEVRAVSRGTTPEATIPSALRTALGADGFALTDFRPTQFTPADLAHAIDVISFDQPSVAKTVGGKVPTSAWDGMPAVSEDYAVARDAIRKRVSKLVDSLVARSSRRSR